MTVIVAQRTPHDCAICCMAMLTGRSYEDVIAAVGDVFDAEKGMHREHEALKRLGFTYSFENGRPSGDIVRLLRPYCLAAEFFRDQAWGRRSLMSVPSLNNPGGWHMIYWTGTTVLDPSDRKTYERFDQLLPEEMVLFREVPA